MRADTSHRLQGLEPDNLLAFLALLGTLRSLEAARSEWGPRIHWDIESPPTRPVLTLRVPGTPATISAAIADGCDLLMRHYDFGEWKVPNMPREEARKLLLSAVEKPADRPHADVLAALMSDIAAREDESVIPTPLCLLFGQGHQYFLTRLSGVARQASAPPRGKGRKVVTFTPAETIEAALFLNWERVDASDSFRWDPAEDRRYALRFQNPSGDESLTVHGANRLAAIGLPILTVVPAMTRGRTKLLTLGVRQGGGETCAVWPIWRRPASLSGVRALLTHPALYDDSDRADAARLRRLGVVEVRRAARISAGKFLNFTRATAQ
jgi:hypothetical protein